MTAAATKERLAELGGNADFVQKLESAESKEELLALLRENGITGSPESILAALSDEQNGELKETELEDVAGGNLLFLLPIAKRAAARLRELIKIC